MSTLRCQSEIMFGHHVPACVQISSLGCVHKIMFGVSSDCVDTRTSCLGRGEFGHGVWRMSGGCSDIMSGMCSDWIWDVFGLGYHWEIVPGTTTDLMVNI